MYQLNSDDIKSITAAEVAFSTTRFLPELEAIPEDFTDGQNPYHSLANNLFMGAGAGSGKLNFKLDVEPKEVADFTYAHLRSFSPSHEHKIAGVAYMMSFIFDFVDSKDSTIN
jgi:hypothetical protein